MAKLNFYDTDAVKAFLLESLVGAREARSEADFERRQSQSWFASYKEQKERARRASKSAGMTSIAWSRKSFRSWRRRKGAPRNERKPV